MLKVRWIFLASILFFIGCSSSVSLVSKATLNEDNYNFSGALIKYKKALIKNPKNQKSLIKLADYYLRNGKDSWGLLLLKKFKTSETNGKNLLLSRYYLNKSDFAKASFFVNLNYEKNQKTKTLKKQINSSRYWQQCRKKIEKFPKNQIYRKQLAYSLFANGFKYSAIAEFEKIIQIDSNNKKVALLLAEFYLQKDITQKAKEYFELVKKIDYRNSRALICLGDIEKNNNRLWKARQYYYLNVRFHPNHPQGNEKFGRINLQVGKKEDGQKYLKKAVKLGVKNYSIFNTLAHLEDINGNKKTADNFKKLAQGYSPSTKSNKIHYVNKIQISIKQLQRFLTFFSANSYKKALISIQIAKNLNKIGKYREAYNYLKKARQKMQNSFTVNLYIGQIEQKLGYLQRSLNSLKRAISISPAQSQPYIEISKIYQAGLFQDSKKYLKILKKGLSANKKSTKLLAMLADFYIPTNKNKAIHYYQRIRPKNQAISNKILKLKKDIKLAKIKKKLENCSNDKKKLRYALQVKDIAGENHPLYLEALKKIKIKTGSIHFLLADSYAKNFFSSFFYKDLQSALFHYNSGQKTERDSTISYKLARLLNWDYKNRQKSVIIFNKLLKTDKTGNSAILKNMLAFQQNRELVSKQLFTIGKIIYNKNSNLVATKYIKNSWNYSQKKHPNMLLALGTIYRDFGFFDEAIKYYKKLSHQKSFLTGNNYPVTLTVIGNLYEAMAKTFPQSTGDLINKYGLKKIDLPFLDKMKAVLNKAKSNGIFYFKRYANLYEKHYIHRNYGIKKATSIGNINTDNYHIIKRISSLFIKAGLTKQGLNFIRQGSKLKPDRHSFSKNIQLLLADTLTKSNKRKEGLAFYKDLIKKYPNDWKILFNYTKNLITGNNLKESKINLAKLSKMRKNNYEINSLFGFVLWKTGKIKRAIYYLKKSQEQNPNDLRIPFWIANIYMQENNTDAGIKFSNKVYSIFKKSLAFNYRNKISKSIFLLTLANLSSLHFYQGNIEKSMKYAKEGASLDNNHTRYFQVQIADILYLQKKYIKAEESYKIGMKNHFGSDLITFKLAQNMVKTQKIIESEKLLKKIIAGKNKFHKLDKVYLLLAKILQTKGNETEAISTLKKMEKLFSHREGVYLAMADIYENKNMDAETKKILLKGLRIIKKAPLLRDKLAWFFIKNNRNPMRALHLAMENCSKYPSNLNYRATLSYIYLKIRDISKYALNFPTIKRDNDSNNRTVTTALFAMENAQKCFDAGENKKALDLIKGSFAKHNSTKTKQDLILAYLN